MAGKRCLMTLAWTVSLTDEMANWSSFSKIWGGCLEGWVAELLYHGLLPLSKMIWYSQRWFDLKNWFDLAKIDWSRKVINSVSAYFIGSLIM